MAPDGTGERMIATGDVVEDPSWSGNGRYLIYTNQITKRYKRKLAMVDLTGYNHQLIKTPGEAAYGVWSPITASPLDSD
jgi:TolB protein